MKYSNITINNTHGNNMPESKERNKKGSDSQSSNKQAGSVLIMALVFLVLTSLIAVTSMNTNVLEIKMAGNLQFQEDQ